jgi:hypothetical protein
VLSFFFNFSFMFMFELLFDFVARRPVRFGVDGSAVGVVPEGETSAGLLVSTPVGVGTVTPDGRLFRGRVLAVDAAGVNEH